MKYFIVTVDTEGDDLWHYQKGQVVGTENSLFIPRFQELCERYGFKPVWLTNYEMVQDQRYVDYIKPKVEAGLCEVGLHVHAWNNPPFYELDDRYGGNPYLIEYPLDVMYDKFKITYDLIVEKIGCRPVSHRAGRWAMNEQYYKLLEKFGILVDCSHTPTVDWSGAPGATIPHGTDYSRVQKSAHRIGNVLEMPTSVTSERLTSALSASSFRDAVRCLLKGKNLWLRPACTSLVDMKRLSRKLDADDTVDYLMFMMHSSEMMPGGSPYFPDSKSIDAMYQDVQQYFEYVKSLGYSGITIKDYVKNYIDV